MEERRYVPKPKRDVNEEEDLEISQEELEARNERSAQENGETHEETEAEPEAEEEPYRDGWGQLLANKNGEADPEAEEEPEEMPDPEESDKMPKESQYAKARKRIANTAKSAVKGGRQTGKKKRKPGLSALLGSGTGAASGMSLAALTGSGQSSHAGLEGLGLGRPAGQKKGKKHKAKMDPMAGLFSGRKHAGLEGLGLGRPAGQKKGKKHKAKMDPMAGLFSGRKHAGLEGLGLGRPAGQKKGKKHKAKMDPMAGLFSGRKHAGLEGLGLGRPSAGRKATHPLFGSRGHNKNPLGF